MPASRPRRTTRATNAPHVTVMAVPAISADVERLAADVVGPLLPGRLRAAGLAVLGGVRVSLVRLVDVPDAADRGGVRLRAAVPDARHPGWLPHVTLARRLPRADLPRAFEVLGHDDVELTCDVLPAVGSGGGGGAHGRASGGSRRAAGSSRDVGRTSSSHGLHARGSAGSPTYRGEPATGKRGAAAARPAVRSPP